MMQKLPKSGFRWMTADELKSFEIDGFDANGDVGAVLEVTMVKILD